jgi:ferritin-like metal-binding protein YciE
MKTIKDLNALFLQYILNLYASEKQVSESMPTIIKRAKHQSLKHALEHHHTVSKEHLSRLDTVLGIIKEKNLVKPTQQGKNFQEKEFTSKAMQGLLEEANDLLASDVEDMVIDAAIIGCVQKIEHYEICTYGTALAYATQLELKKAAVLLEKTLNEEYDADDLLTSLATAALNKEGVSATQQATGKKSPAKERVPGEEAGNQRKNTQVSISERTIHSPGGRAGTSHRGYGSGESRGH